MGSSADITDEDLVAYLDGALDPARREAICAAIDSDGRLAGRIAALSFDRDELLTALDAVADIAPVDELRARLRSAATPRRREWPRAGVKLLRIAAMLLVGVLVGYVIGVRSSPEPGKDWRHAVADYQALYSPSTLAPIARDVEVERRKVASIGSTLGLPITFDALHVAGLDFKRAQLLQFGGQPLAQFAYVNSGGVPVSFCVFQTGEADRPLQSERMRGLSVMVWSEHGYGFIVIGAVSAEDLKQSATALAKQLQL
jgi:anti-sigma factor RsiW